MNSVVMMSFRPKARYNLSSNVRLVSQKTVELSRHRQADPEDLNSPPDTQIANRSRMFDHQKLHKPSGFFDIGVFVNFRRFTIWARRKITHEHGHDAAVWRPLQFPRGNAAIAATDNYVVIAAAYSAASSAA